MIVEEKLRVFEFWLIYKDKKLGEKLTKVRKLIISDKYTKCDSAIERYKLLLKSLDKNPKKLDWFQALYVVNALRNYIVHANPFAYTFKLSSESTYAGLDFPDKTNKMLKQLIARELIPKLEEIDSACPISLLIGSERVTNFVSDTVKTFSLEFASSIVGDTDTDKFVILLLSTDFS